MGEKQWRVGELAAEVGLTVRTLHHFDEIGLLTPRERSASGHRLYCEPDVRRLYRILALRDLGMPLAEIAASLDGAGDPLGSVIERHLHAVDQRLSAQQEVRRRLATLVTAARQTTDPTVDQLVQAMEAMMKSSYFTPEQLARLKERHHEVGADAFGRWRQRWTDLDAEARLQAEQELDPADPQAQDLARRWSDLMDEMTGGDRRILSSMYAKLDGRGAEAATLGAVSTAAWQHVKRALLLGYRSPSAPGQGDPQPG